jgi:hypothetical protein
VLSCDAYPKRDLVAVILYDIAKSRQMYPVPTDDTIFQNMTSYLTDLVVMRPLDRRDVICDFGQGCIFRPELKVFHIQDYHSHLRSGDFFLEGKGRQLVWIRLQLSICTYDLQACVVNRSDLFCVLSKLS